MLTKTTEMEEMEEKSNENQAPEWVDAELLDDEETEAAAEENRAEDKKEMSETEMASRIQCLEQNLAKKTEEAEALQQQYVRLQADFDNFRKRARQEKEDTAKYITGDTLASLLPVLDNLERALQGGSGCQESKDFVVGVEMVYRQLQETLKNLGLEHIPAVGETFDPQWHEAIAMVEAEEEKKGLIVEELQKGYRFKDKLLRPSMVKVGQ